MFFRQNFDQKPSIPKKIVKFRFGIAGTDNETGYDYCSAAVATLSLTEPGLQQVDAKFVKMGPVEFLFQTTKIRPQIVFLTKK